VEAFGDMDSLDDQAVGPAMPSEIKLPRGGSHERSLLHRPGHSQENNSLVRQGTIASERKALSKWLLELPGPWYGAMEATIFTGRVSSASYQRSGTNTCKPN
jgi:hypothetical protein